MQWDYTIGIGNKMSFSNRVREELSKLEIESKLVALLEL